MPKKKQTAKHPHHAYHKIVVLLFVILLLTIIYAFVRHYKAHHLLTVD